MHDALGELLAKQTITELIYRYCRALDRMDREMALSLWHEDATLDYGSLYKGGREGFLDKAWAIHETLNFHSHQVTNILIEVDGDSAASESYYTAALRQSVTGGNDTQFEVRGRYLDRWSKRSEKWAMQSRAVALDFSDIREIVTDGPEANGRRDRDDPSFAYIR